MKRLLAQSGAIVLAVELQLVAAAGAASAAEEARPGVSIPVVPQVQSDAVTGGGEVKTWKPGDPVQVVPDLREDQPTTITATGQPHVSAPIVRAPVAPQTLEGDLRTLQKAEPYREGGPVRVVPDLREDDAKG